MKKIVILAGLVAALLNSNVFAASATVEEGTASGIAGMPNNPNQQSFALMVKENINNSFAGDIGMLNVQTTHAPTPSINTRAETGVTGTVPVVGSVSVYTRVAVGEHWFNTTNFPYYSIEPGVIVPLGSGFSAKIGWRFRTAFNPANDDTTRTPRVGVNYNVTDRDIVGVRYDGSRGYLNQNTVAVNYTRSF